LSSQLEMETGTKRRAQADSLQSRWCFFL